jgi:hypothetical protein
LTAEVAEDDAIATGSIGECRRSNVMTTVLMTVVAGVTLLDDEVSRRKVSDD